MAIKFANGKKYFILVKRRSLVIFINLKIMKEDRIHKSKILATNSPICFFIVI